MSVQASGASYAFLPTDAEEARLQRQAAFWDPPTRQLFEAAGVRAGMKVLDLGSGAGDVAMVAAELVGPTGRVVGIDSNPRVLDTARARAQAAGHANISFLAGDLREASLDDDFDAVVGRLILCHMQDPAAILRRLVPHLRPQGVAAFYDLDFTLDGPSDPPSSVHQQAMQWIRQGCAYAGIETAMGTKLHQTFVAAGFEAPEMRVDGVMGGSRRFVEEYTVYAAETVRALLPLLVKGGIATEQEVDIETLAARWRDEVLDLGSVIRSYLFMGAWAYKARV